MKAGVYQTPNANLIYVAKDRTIKATTLSPSSWPGTKVSHRSADDTVLIAGTEYRCHRVSDVPNGCTSPMDALNVYVRTKRAPRRNEAVVDMPGEHAARQEAYYRYASGGFIDKPAEGLIGEAGTTTYLHTSGDVDAIPNDRRYGVVDAFTDAIRENFRDFVENLIDGTLHEADDDNFALNVDDGPRTALKRQGFRFCHGQSARKHRKQRHEVRFVPEIGCYAWRAST